MSQFHILYVITPHERPDYRLVKAFLWGDERAVDSDGNADSPASRLWTELTLEPRDNPRERVDIDEHKHQPLTLKVRSENQLIAARVAYLLAYYTKGKISFTESGPYTR